MKSLILDAGNSQTKLFGWEGRHQAPVLESGPAPLLKTVGQWKTPDRHGDWGNLTNSILTACDPYPGLPLVVTSVVPEVVAGLEILHEDLVLVDHRLEMPFSCSVDDPSAIGSDRYCNVAAAVGAGLPSALVVDVGTATTFDLLVERVFIGGLIAPGPEFSLQGLGAGAAQLDPVAFAPAPLKAGKSTTEAMASGAWNTGIGGINYCIEGLLRLYGPLPVILTGGLGHHLQADGRVYDAHFTLRGAAVLAGLLTP